MRQQKCLLPGVYHRPISTLTAVTAAVFTSSLWCVFLMICLIRTETLSHLHSAQCEISLQIFQSQKTCQMK